MKTNRDCRFNSFYDIVLFSVSAKLIHCFYTNHMIFYAFRHSSVGGSQKGFQHIRVLIDKVERGNNTNTINRFYTCLESAK